MKSAVFMFCPEEGAARATFLPIVHVGYHSAVGLELQSAVQTFFTRRGARKS